MSNTQKDDAERTRKIWPWIAALLTFLGWGVGLFYARRTKAAIRMAVAQVLLILVAIMGLCAYMYFGGPANLGLIDPRSAAKDFINLGISAAVGIGVWRFVAGQPNAVPQGRPARLLGYLAIWLLPVVAAVALALIMRSTFFQPFNTPAASMQPSLQRGEYFLVTKWSYGYSRYSFAPFQSMLPAGRLLSRQPQRGDIVVFRPPADSGKDYVKRLIGFPGDEISMVSGRLYINGNPVQKDFVGMSEIACDGSNTQGAVYRETLDSGVAYDVHECYGDEGPLDNVGPYNVPPGNFFLLGDNRDQSRDSRVIRQIGYIPFDNLVGKVQLQRQ